MYSCIIIKGRILRLWSVCSSPKSVWILISGTHLIWYHLVFMASCIMQPYSLSRSYTQIKKFSEFTISEWETNIYHTDLPSPKRPQMMSYSDMISKWITTVQTSRWTAVGLLVCLFSNENKLNCSFVSFESWNNASRLRGIVLASDNTTPWKITCWQ